MDRSNTASRFNAGRSYARAAASFASCAADQFALAGAGARAERAAKLAAELEQLARPELDPGTVSPAGAAS